MRISTKEFRPANRPKQALRFRAQPDENRATGDRFEPSSRPVRFAKRALRLGTGLVLGSGLGALGAACGGIYAGTVVLPLLVATQKFDAQHRLWVAKTLGGACQEPPSFGASLSQEILSPLHMAWDGLKWGLDFGLA